jgi:hypothetical protein
MFDKYINIESVCMAICDRECRFFEVERLLCCKLFCLVLVEIWECFFI